jgi:hypothetical protein
MAIKDELDLSSGNAASLQRTKNIQNYSSLFERKIINAAILL